MLSNKAFDILKWICMVFLGAFGTLYQGLSVIWNLPYGNEIADTCYKLAVFLGVCLGISTIQYKHNQLTVEADVVNGSNLFESFDEEEFEEEE